MEPQKKYPAFLFWIVFFFILYAIGATYYRAFITKDFDVISEEETEDAMPEEELGGF